MQGWWYGMTRGAMGHYANMPCARPLHVCEVQGSSDVISGIASCCRMHGLQMIGAPQMHLDTSTVSVQLHRDHTIYSSPNDTMAINRVCVLRQGKL